MIAVKYIRKEWEKKKKYPFSFLGASPPLLGAVHHLSLNALFLPTYFEKQPFLHFIFLANLQCNSHDKGLYYHFRITPSYDDLHFIFCMFPSHTEIKGKLMTEALWSY